PRYFGDGMLIAVACYTRHCVHQRVVDEKLIVGGNWCLSRNGDLVTRIDKQMLLSRRGKFQFKPSIPKRRQVVGGLSIVPIVAFQENTQLSSVANVTREKF